MNQELLSLFFPDGILEYFEIESFSNGSTELQFHLIEKAIPPKEYENQPLQKRGFHEPITLEDFPIRGKIVKLFIKRRRWALKGDDKKISRDWSLVAKGTRMSKEYASFLKEIARY